MSKSNHSKIEKLTAGRARLSSKHPTSYKLTDTALNIISTLAAKRGIAKSALIENLLRDEYQAEIESERQRTIKSAAVKNGLLID